MEPRVVILSRPDEVTSLRQSYGSVNNAAFFLSSRGSDITSNITSSQTYVDAIEHVTNAIPKHWRRARVSRDQLDRFLFEPGDIIAAIGQDGLVANVAKYLHNDQVVIGFNDMPGKNPGILVKHAVWEVHDLFKRAAEHPDDAETRTMVQCTLDDGQSLTCLNEIFIGHSSHQSAKYALQYNGQHENQSSSGLIVSTGTGATGWASSIAHQLDVGRDEIPEPEEDFLLFLVREAWESPYYGRRILHGVVEYDRPLQITSMMEADGVIFGDGIEVDHLNFSYGRIATLSVADQVLRLL